MINYPERLEAAGSIWWLHIRCGARDGSIRKAQARVKMAIGES
jgi:hypothetical protein